MSSREIDNAIGSRHCLVCGGKFPSTQTVCPKDSSPLVATREDSIIGTTLSGFEIKSMLGKGGMSVVYKAEHQMMHRLVAIKVLIANDPLSLKRFNLEARLAASLQHPNIVTMFDFGVSEEGLPFIAMDFIEGRTLAGVIASDGALPYTRALPIFLQACDALAYAHSKGVIHRDLKPSNFMLVQTETTERLVLLDFGIAKQLEPTEEMQQLTATGDIFGSPLYMSPEQCIGQKLDARADIYSLGCVMYEVLASRPPFVGKTALDTLQMHIHEQPRSFKDLNKDLEVPPYLEHIVLKSLERDLARRYQTVTELWDDLKKFEKNPTGPFGTVPDSVPTTPASADFNPEMELERLESRSEASDKEPAAPVARKRIRYFDALIVVLALLVTAPAIYLLNPHSYHAPSSGTASGVGDWETLNRQVLDSLASGDYAAASSAATRALAAARNFGPSDPRLAIALENASKVLYKTDQFHQAEKNIKVCMKIREKSFGTQSASYAQSMNDLGNIYCAEGNYGAAYSVLKKSLDTRLKLGNNQQTNSVVESEQSLANYYNRRGQWQQSMPLWQIVNDFRAREAVTAERIAAVNGMARANELIGDAKAERKALDLYTSAVSLAAKNLGSQHPAVADSLVGRGVVRFYFHNDAEAMNDFNQAFAIRRHVFGERSLKCAEVLACLARLNESRGQSALARQQLEKAVSIVNALLPVDNHDRKRLKQELDHLK